MFCDFGHDNAIKSFVLARVMYFKATNVKIAGLRDGRRCPNLSLSRFNIVGETDNVPSAFEQTLPAWTRRESYQLGCLIEHGVSYRSFLQLL